MPTNAKPAGANDGFHVSNWRALEKGPLRGFFSIVTPFGLKVNECAVFERDATRWVSMPSRPYTKQDGTKAYQPIVNFDSREAKHRFQDAALAALDAFLKGGGGIKS